MQFSSKCALVGNAGSGKTTYARKIQAQTKSEILDLDNITWDRGRLQKRREVADSLIEMNAFIAKNPEGWIIEGCYGELIESSLKHSPLFIFLDPGEERCLEQCRQRPWESHKYASKADQDKLLEFLLSWVSEYYRREGPMSHAFHKHLFDSYKGPKLLLRDF